jgi:hypothetical protein
MLLRFKLPLSFLKKMKYNQTSDYSMYISFKTHSLTLGAWWSSTTCVISAYVSSNPVHDEVYSIHYHVIKFVCDL